MVMVDMVVVNDGCGNCNVIEDEMTIITHLFHINVYEIEIGLLVKSGVISGMTMMSCKV